MKSSTMIGGNGSFERHASDFYETPPEATHALLDQINIPLTAKVWEPACGNSAISNVLKDRGFDVFSSDIRPEADGYDLDFLDGLSVETDWIITNPPFNLADSFIETAWRQKVKFAFLLKATFWNTAQHGRLFKRCPPTGIYPLTWRPAIAPDRGKGPTMDFTWVVWRHVSEFVPLARPSATKSMKEV